MITTSQLFLKRVFDLCLALLLLPMLLVPILVLILLATLDTQHWGLFSQTRIGQHGQPFTIYKLRTLKGHSHALGSMHTSTTALGGFLRRYKWDELPQLLNVLKGDMGFVGPRPDLPGFADVLTGEDRMILKVKPGITGPATLKYRDEDLLLSQQADPDTYNRTIIWTDKVKINKMYVQDWSFYLDLKYMIQSIFN